MISDALSEVFSGRPRCEVITRDMIPAVVGELALGETGVVFADKDKGFGQIRGVDFLVIGKVNHISHDRVQQHVASADNLDPPPEKSTESSGGILGAIFSSKSQRDRKAREERERRRRAEQNAHRTETWRRSEISGSCMVIAIPSGVVLRQKAFNAVGLAQTDQAAMKLALEDARRQFQADVVPVVESQIPVLEGPVTEISRDVGDAYIRIKIGTVQGVTPGMLFEIVGLVPRPQMDGSIIYDKKTVGYAVATEVDTAWSKLAPVKLDQKHTSDLDLLGKLTKDTVAREANLTLPR